VRRERAIENRFVGNLSHRPARSRPGRRSGDFCGRAQERTRAPRIDLVRTRSKRPRTVRTISAESETDCPLPLAGEGKGEGANFRAAHRAPNRRSQPFAALEVHRAEISRPHPVPLPRGGIGQSRIALLGISRTGRRDPGAAGDLVTSADEPSSVHELCASISCGRAQERPRATR
jgi:hypothetical protein